MMTDLLYLNHVQFYTGYNKVFALHKHSRCFTELKTRLHNECYHENSNFFVTKRNKTHCCYKWLQILSSTFKYLSNNKSSVPDHDK